MKLSEIFQNVYIYKIHLDSCSGQILQKFPCSSSISNKSLQLKKLAQRTRGEESGRESSDFSVWRVQIWNLTSRLKPMCSWMRWSNAVISAAFRSFPSNKSKWMRTEQINSVRLNRGLNYMQCKVIVLGCDGKLLVFLRSPVAHASPRGGGGLHFVYFLNWVISEIWRRRRTYPEWAGGAEGVHGGWEGGSGWASLAGGDARWSRSLRCGPAKLRGSWGALPWMSVRHECHPWICTCLNSRGIWI